MDRINRNQIVIETFLPTILPSFYVLEVRRCCSWEPWPTGAEGRLLLLGCAAAGTPEPTRADHGVEE